MYKFFVLIMCLILVFSPLSLARLTPANVGNLATSADASGGGEDERNVFDQEKEHEREGTINAPGSKKCLNTDLLHCTPGKASDNLCDQQGQTQASMKDYQNYYESMKENLEGLANGFGDQCIICSELIDKTRKRYKDCKLDLPANPEEWASADVKDLVGKCAEAGEKLCPAGGKKEACTQGSEDGGEETKCPLCNALNCAMGEEGSTFEPYKDDQCQSQGDDAKCEAGGAGGGGPPGEHADGKPTNDDKLGVIGSQQKTQKGKCKYQGCHPVKKQKNAVLSPDGIVECQQNILDTYDACKVEGAKEVGADKGCLGGEDPCKIGGKVKDVSGQVGKMNDAAGKAVDEMEKTRGVICAGSQKGDQSASHADAVKGAGKALKDTSGMMKDGYQQKLECIVKLTRNPKFKQDIGQAEGTTADGKKPETEKYGPSAKEFEKCKEIKADDPKGPVKAASASTGACSDKNEKSPIPKQLTTVPTPRANPRRPVAVSAYTTSWLSFSWTESIAEFAGQNPTLPKGNKENWAKTGNNVVGQCTAKKGGEQKHKDRGFDVWDNKQAADNLAALDPEKDLFGNTKGCHDYNSESKDPNASPSPGPGDSPGGENPNASPGPGDNSGGGGSGGGGGDQGSPSPDAGGGGGGGGMPQMPQQGGDDQQDDQDDQQDDQNGDQNGDPSDDIVYSVQCSDICSVCYDTSNAHCHLSKKICICEIGNTWVETTLGCTPESVEKEDELRQCCENSFGTSMSTGISSSGSTGQQYTRQQLQNMCSGSSSSGVSFDYCNGEGGVCCYYGFEMQTREKACSESQCPEIHAPVCSTMADGTKKTHDNDCLANNDDNVVSFTRGACEDCGDEVNSVCATLKDGTKETMNNPCLANNDPDVETYTMGACDANGEFDPRDDDKDGKVDEDPIDGIDNDGDGLIDEDPPNGGGDDGSKTCVDLCDLLFTGSRSTACKSGCLSTEVSCESSCFTLYPVSDENNAVGRLACLKECNSPPAAGKCIETCLNNDISTDVLKCSRACKSAQPDLQIEMTLLRNDATQNTFFGGEKTQVRTTLSNVGTFDFSGKITFTFIVMDNCNCPLCPEGTLCQCDCDEEESVIDSFDFYIKIGEEQNFVSKYIDLPQDYVNKSMKVIATVYDPAEDIVAEISSGINYIIEMQPLEVIDAYMLNKHEEKITTAYFGSKIKGAIMIRSQVFPITVHMYLASDVGVIDGSEQEHVISYTTENTVLETGELQVPEDLIGSVIRIGVKVVQKETILFDTVLSEQLNDLGDCRQTLSYTCLKTMGKLKMTYPMAFVEVSTPKLTIIEAGFMDSGGRWFNEAFKETTAKGQVEVRNDVEIPFKGTITLSIRDSLNTVKTESSESVTLSDATVAKLQTESTTLSLLEAGEYYDYESFRVHITATNENGKIWMSEFIDSKLFPFSELTLHKKDYEGTTTTIDTSFIVEDCVLHLLCQGCFPTCEIYVNPKTCSIIPENCGCTCSVR